MNIGSNNSLTYLKPCNTWFKIFKQYGKCQDRDCETQYIFHGVRLFDFKLFVDKKNHIIIKNGNCQYPMFSFYETLDFLNKKGDAVVLISLERQSEYMTENMLKSIERKFIEICQVIENIYEDIGFCGGYRQSDKSKIYSFTWEEQHGLPIMINPSEWSRLYRFVTMWCPSFIGKLNKKYIDKYENEHGFLLLNYVNKR